MPIQDLDVSEFLVKEEFQAFVVLMYFTLNRVEVYALEFPFKVV